MSTSFRFKSFLFDKSVRIFCVSTFLTVDRNKFNAI